MKPKEAKKLLRMWVENDVNVAVCFIGGMGIGKSWIPKELAKELGYGYDGIFPSQMGDGSEMTGIPYRDGCIQKWSIPENLPSASESYKCRLCLYDDVKHTHDKGFYVVDELNTAPIDIRNAMMEFMLSGSIHRNKIGDKWIRVACMNPETDGFQVETLSKALLRRMMLIKVEPDFESWENWAKGKLNEKVVGFVNRNREFLYKPEKFDITAEFNPDSYRFLSEIITKLPWSEIQEDIRFEILMGLGGKEMAASFIQDENESKKCMSPEELFKNYKNNVEKFVNQREDLMLKSVEKTIEYINKIQRLEKNTALNIADLISKVGAEQQVLIVKSLNYEIHGKIHSAICISEGCKKPQNTDTDISMEQVLANAKKVLSNLPENPYNSILKVKIKIREVALDQKESGKVPSP